MNEETKKTATASTAAQKAAAPEADVKSGDLTVQDLNTIKAIIDVASQRGAFKANEMQAVGTTYNKLESFLNAIQAQQAAAAKSAPAAAATTAAPVGDKK
jgi:hypothetical protein